MALNRWLRALVACVLLLWGLYMHYGSVFSDVFQSVPGDLGDARFNAIILEHNYRFLTGQWPATFWDLPWMFYPFKGGLALSDVLTGNLLTYAPFRFLGLDPLQAFAGWFVLSSILNFICAFLLLRVLGARDWASSVGAFLITFAFARGGFLNHAQLIPQYPTFLSILFFALYCRESLEGKKIFFLVAAFASFAWQFWMGFYLWWFYLFALCLIGVSLLFVPSLLRWILRDMRTRPIAWLLAGTTAGILLTPLALHYLTAQKQMGTRGFGEIANYLPVAGAFFFPPAETVFYNAFHQRFAAQGLSHEVRMFLGFGFLLAVALGCVLAFKEKNRNEDVWLSRRLVLIVGSLFVLIVWFSLKRSDGYSLWKYVYLYVPGASALRAVGRIVLLLLVLGVFPIVYLMDSLPSRYGKKGMLAAFLLGCLLMAEQSAFFSSRFSIAEHDARLNKIEQHAATHLNANCEALYIKSDDSRPEFAQIDAMWFGLTRGLNTVNGYSGNFPSEWWERLRSHKEASPQRLKEWLQSMGNSDLAEKACFIDLARQ